MDELYGWPLLRLIVVRQLLPILALIGVVTATVWSCNASGSRSSEGVAYQDTAAVAGARPVPQVMGGPDKAKPGKLAATRPPPGAAPAKPAPQNGANPGPANAIPPSGSAALCPTRKSGGRCFNFQPINGPCIWSNGRKIANIKRGWELNLQPGWFGANYWNAWCKLGMAESNWDTNDLGPYVRGLGQACGIPQALPCSKLHGITSADGQIIWMRDYIKERYGNPNNAWVHEYQHEWY